jgi:poly(3-hydroxybutyrate) depolymerase
MTNFAGSDFVHVPASTTALYSEEWMHAGHSRRAFFRIPTTPRLALVILHPAASSGKGILQSGKWLELEDVAVCAPEGLVQFPEQEPHPVKNVRCWSSGEAACASRSIDDLGFLNEATDRFLTKLPKDVAVCLVGHSNGCAMGFRLLSQAQHPFQAAVLASATWAQPTAAVRGVPLLYMTGTADPVFPWNEARFVVTPWFRHHTEPAIKTVDEWLRASGLGDTVGQGLCNSHGLRTTWRDAPHRVFVFQLLEGQGHHWPTRQAIPRELEAVLGPNQEYLCATSLALEFLREHTEAKPPTSCAGDMV